MDTQTLDAETTDATDLRISIFYKKTAGSKVEMNFKTEISFRGVQPPGPIESRAACGVLLISLGCFELQTNARGLPLNEWEGVVVVDTGTRSIYATDREPANAREIVRAMAQTFARSAGIPGDLTESMAASFIGDAVQLLNADPIKFNAPGGFA